MVHEHNQDISPTKWRLIRGNRRLNLQAKRTLDINDKVGVRLNKTFRSLVGHAGGFENLQFVERDARNYIGQQRRAFGKEGDVSFEMVSLAKKGGLNWLYKTFSKA